MKLLIFLNVLILTSILAAKANAVRAPVRLTNGDNQFEGRVEVYYGGQWGTVCDDNWDIVDANVVCYQLGFGKAHRVYTRGYFGSGSSTMPIWLDGVQCTAGDRYLSECRHNGWRNNDCSHSEDVGLVCDSTTRAPVRLTNGVNQFEGRVEVYYNGQWGTVCDNNWDMVDANVVCYQLGFGKAWRAYTYGYFGSGSSSMPIWLGEIQCTTRDRYLSECRHNGWGNNDCSHYEDAGVACLEAGCTEGDIRLINGSDVYEGRVEVCYNKEWGTVCNIWSISEGTVACRQLGYSFVGVTTSASFGRGKGPIWLDTLQCEGYETQLMDCYHGGFGNNDCSHYEDVGVICDNSYDDSYPHPTGNRLSDVAIAGITIGGFLALVLIGTSVIVGIICWRHNHANRTTQQPDQQMLLPSLPSNNPPPDRQTQLPAVCYANLECTGPEPQYIPES
ncbi:neurotrypsin-like [Dysidea avara]|uniref:neurotrypsin-like n=1 Tax=Dysidea avara TaxID=196820 RepID=UPI00332ECE14